MAESGFNKFLVMPDIRRLAANEWSLLDKVEEPFSPDPEKSVAVVAQNAMGEIVGRCFLVSPVHVEGIWLDPAWRNRTLFYRLICRIEEEAKAEGIRKLLAFAATPEMAEYIERLGYEYTPVSVWSKELS